MTNTWLGRGGVMKGWGFGKTVNFVVFGPKKGQKMYFDFVHYLPFVCWCDRKNYIDSCIRILSNLVLN